MKKGFINILLAIGIVGAFALGAFAYHKAQLAEDVKLGAQVYTTQLSDTLGTFRNQVNSSTANLNTELENVSSTVINLSSTLNLVPVANGGTGITTTPSNAQFLSASGTSPAWKTLSFGAGLNTTTTATSVQINTTGLDPTANYAWSGTNTYSTGTQTFKVTTTFQSSTIFTGPLTASNTATFNASATFNGLIDLTNATISSTLLYTTSSILAPPGGSLACNGATLFGSTTTIQSDGTQRAAITLSGGFMYSNGGTQISATTANLLVDGTTSISSGYSVQAVGAGAGAGLALSTTTGVLSVGAHTINASFTNTGSAGCANVGTLSLSGFVVMIRTR